METKNIKYPYLPEGKTIKYVAMDNIFMQAAKKFAHENSLDSTVQTGSAVVVNNTIVGLGANGSDYHKTHECERVRRGVPTGQGYELCEGCHPKNHSEPRAIKNAQEKGHDTREADLYLWGHWWCCKPCWDEMISAGIRDVYLLKDSDIIFNLNNPNNIIGHQFDN